LLALTRGPFAVGARPLAVYGTTPVGRHGPTLGRCGSVSGGAPAVLGCARHDLASRAVRHNARTHVEFAITLCTRLVAHRSRAVATVTASVTGSRGAGAPRDGLTALARIVVACVAHEIVQAEVAASLQITITCSLVHDRGSLIFVGHGFVGIGRGLLAVRPRLLAIRERLFTVGALAILAQARDRRSVALRDRRAGAWRVRRALT
jgi:hypothetical protein